MVFPLLHVVTFLYVKLGWHRQLFGKVQFPLPEQTLELVDRNPKHDVTLHDGPIQPELQTQVSGAVQFPFEVQTVDDVELIPKHDVTLHVDPDQPVLQLQVSGEVHCPFPEQTDGEVAATP